ncbi:hypothetical protein ACLBSJ_34025, partial [Klebsiella pneumoniae]|uniref:hypothetical protein n=1 Tax=Klebsiella pneumoniae TaxID=573 RepID=UPI0039692ECF
TVGYNRLNPRTSTDGAGSEAAREEEDLLQKHYRGMAEGAKELRINRPRRQRLHGQLQRQGAQAHFPRLL